MTSCDFIPSYRLLWEDGELTNRREAAWRRLSTCDLCAHNCGVDRRSGKKGVCQADDSVQVSGYGPHFGEEDVLVGKRGSGTIFFTGCNLKCVFCQNWDVSHLAEGETVTPDRLAAIMMELQDNGCHNVNLVSPTHYIPQILSAVELACRQGLCVPLVFNCGGYESLEALRLLDGIVDIYMPDVKFWDRGTGKKLAGAADYPKAVQAALKEMHRQVGDLVTTPAGLAQKGLIVRHLVLPGTLAGTKDVVEFIAGELSPNTYINIMDQYSPEFRAKEHEHLKRRITSKEYSEALEVARSAGLHRFA